MKFAHLADVHVGAWRDPAMKGLSLEALRRAAAKIIEEKVDFVIIAGDLFNTAVPAIDHLQETVMILKKFKTAGMPVYVVPGSHDYNAGGKTILDVLEEAELMKSVMKGQVSGDLLSMRFTLDKKTNAKLVGIGGRRGSLDQKEYKNLDLKSLEEEEGFKIFVFHTSIEELKPDEMYAMLSISVNELPAGFSYYAGGHVHVVDRKDFPGRENVIYPGPIFPANFPELWSLGRGGFFIYDEGKIDYHALNIKSVFRIEVSAEGKTPEQVSHELESRIAMKEFNDSVVLVRVHGKLRSGRPGDIDFKNFSKEIYAKSAYFVMRNTSALSSEEFLSETIHSGSADEIEDELVAEMTSSRKHKIKDEPGMIKRLILAMSDEQKDGEKKYEYDARIKREVDSLFS